MRPYRFLATCVLPVWFASCSAFEEPAIPVIPSRVAETAPAAAKAESAAGNALAPAEETASSTSPVPYPFTTCAVIRKDFNGQPKHRRIYRNHEICFCCTPCLHAFEANPEAYFPRIAEAAAAKARGESVNSGW